MKKLVNCISNIVLKLKEKRVFEILYYVAIFNYTFLIGYSSSEIIKIPETLETIMYLTSLGFALPKVLFEKYNKKELLIVGIIYVMGFACVVASGKTMLLIVPTLLVGVKNTNPRIIAKIVLSICLSYALIHAIASFVIYIKDGKEVLRFLHLDRTKFKADDNINACFSSNHNRYGIRWVSSLICYLYLTDRDNKRYIKAVILFLVTIFVYALCQSIGTLVMMLAFDFYILLEKIKPFDFLLNIFKYFSLVVSILYSYISQYANLDSPLFSFLNRLTTGRITVALNDRANYGISFFMPMFKNEELIDFATDNGVLYFVIKWGLLFTLVLLALIILLGFVYKNDNFNTFTMSMMFIYAMSQRTPRHITITLIPLLVMYNFFEIESNKSKVLKESI